MSTPSKVTSPRRTRKSKSIPVALNVVASVVFIAPEIRKTQALSDWNKAFGSYINTLSNDEQTLVKKCLAFTLTKPAHREHLHGACPVVPFPVGGKRGAQIAKEA